MLDATDRIESLDERRFQPDVNAGEIVFDLGQFACADDRYHRRSPLPKPRQGDLGRRVAALTGQRNDLTDDGFLASVRGHELLHAGVALPGVFGPARLQLFAGQHPARQVATRL